MRYFILLALLACGPKPTPPGSPVQPTDHRFIAKQVHQRINQIRVSKGLQALEWNPELATVATKHSRDMGRRDYFSHDSPEGHDFSARYQAEGIDCRVPVGGGQFYIGGENIHKTWRAEGTRHWSDGRQEEVGLRSVRDVAEQAVQGWMDSPGHKENLLKPFWKTEGIGVWLRSDGAIFVTQNFC